MLNKCLLGSSGQSVKELLALDFIGASKGTPYFKLLNGPSYLAFSDMVTAGKANYSRTDSNTTVVTALQNQTTNLLQQSNNFSNAYWSGYYAKPSDLAQNAVDPNGVPNSAWSFSYNGLTGSGGNFGGVFANGASASTTYTVSLWMRADVSTSVAFGLDDGSAPLLTIGTTWQRYSYTGVTAANLRLFQFFLYKGNNPGWVGTNKVYFYGAQTEQGVTTPSTYVPTTTSSLTISDPNGQLQGVVNYAASRTNLITYSQAIGGTNWSPTASQTIILNAATAPDGTTTATSCTPTAQYDGVNQTVSAVVGSTTYTGSVWLRVPTGTRTLQIQFYDGTNYYITNCNVTTTWTRFSVTFTTVASPTSKTFKIQDANASGFVTYYAWGAQLELSNLSQITYPTPYIATTSAAVTVQDPRVTNMGMLVEESRTNLVTYSQAIGGTNWNANGTTVLNAATAPDGTTTATSCTPAARYDQYNQTVSAVAGSTTYTASVWLRSPSGPRTLQIQFYDGTNYYQSNCNVTTTWTRFSLTFTTVASPTSKIFAIQDANTSGFVTYYAWGAQFEPGVSFPSSLIPTTSVSATRGADNSYITGLSSVLNAPITMTAWGNMNVASDGTIRILASPSDGTINNRVDLRRNSDNVAYAIDVVSSSFQSAAAGSGKTGVRVLKMAGRFRSGAFSGSADGAAPVNGSQTGYPVGMSRLDIGAQGSGGSNFFNGYLQKIVIQGDTSDATLQRLTV